MRFTITLNNKRNKLYLLQIILSFMLSFMFGDSRVYLLLHVHVRKSFTVVENKFQRENNLVNIPGS